MERKRDMEILIQFVLLVGGFSLLAKGADWFVVSVYYEYRIIAELRNIRDNK